MYACTYQLYNPREQQGHQALRTARDSHEGHITLPAAHTAILLMFLNFRITKHTSRTGRNQSLNTQSLIKRGIYFDRTVDYECITEEYFIDCEAFMTNILIICIKSGASNFIIVSLNYDKISTLIIPIHVFRNINHYQIGTFTSLNK